jgi:hypothetical protein
VERSHWIAQLASLLRVPDSAIATDIASFKDDLDAYTQNTETQQVGPVKGGEIQKELPDAVHEMLLSVVLKNPTLVREEIKALPSDLVEKRTMNIMRQIADEPQPFEFQAFVAKFSGEEALQLEFAHLRSQELWQEFSDADLKLEFHTLVAMIRRRAINARLANLQFDVKEAEAMKNSKRLTELAGEFNNLAQQLILTHHPYAPQEKIKETGQNKKAAQEENFEVKAESETENENQETLPSGETNL